MLVDFRCENVLKDNQRWYAIKAVRKKISIIRIEVTNKGPSDARLDLGSSRLTAGGKEFAPEKPDVVLRKFSEFTWDFLVFALLDFHPLLALFDLTLFLFGPFYNRRLKRQLALLSDGEMSLSPGETRTALIAFRGVKAEPERLTLSCRNGQGAEERLQQEFNVKT